MGQGDLVPASLGPKSVCGIEGVDGLQIVAEGQLAVVGPESRSRPWDLRLQQAGERGLADSVHALLADVRREFGGYVSRNYAAWLSGSVSRPPLSTDVVERFVAPHPSSDLGPVAQLVRAHA